MNVTLIFLIVFLMFELELIVYTCVLLLKYFLLISVPRYWSGSLIVFPPQFKSSVTFLCMSLDFCLSLKYHPHI